MRLSVGSGLGLVTNDVVPVGGAGINNLLEELGNERGGKGQNEGFVVLSGLLSKLHDGRRADCDEVLAHILYRVSRKIESLTSEVEATNVVDLSILNELPDLGLLQVVDIVVVGGTEISAQASVVASNDNTASASLLLGVDSVLNTETSSLDGIVEDGRVLIVTSTTEVDNAVGRENVLGASGRVLGSTTGNELGVVVVQEVLIEGDMLLLGEDSIVGLEAILVEQGLVTKGLDVCERRGRSARHPCKIFEAIGPRKCPGKSQAEPQGTGHHIPRRGFSKQRRENSLGAMVLNCLTDGGNKADLEGKSLRMEGLLLVGLTQRLERGAWSVFGGRDGAMPETRSAEGRLMRRGRLVGLNMLNVFGENYD